MHSLGEALLDLWPKAGYSGKPGHVGAGDLPPLWKVDEARVSPAKEWRQRAEGISDPHGLISFSVLGW